MQDFIRHHGEYVTLFHGLKCTCALMQTGTAFPDPNRAQPGCAACHGFGWVWIPAGRIHGLVTGISQQKDLVAAGIALPGDMVFSPGPDIDDPLSDYDKVQLPWPTPYEGELITRGSGVSDTTYYGVMAVSSDSCITADPITGDITQYNEGTDYIISPPDAIITWLTGHGPAVGAVYSFRYTAMIDWVCFVPPMPRRERGTSLGQRVVLRKKHVAFNGQ